MNRLIAVKTLSPAAEQKALNLILSFSSTRATIVEIGTNITPLNKLNIL